MNLPAVEGHWRVRREPSRPGRPMDRARTWDVEAGLVLETPRRWLRLFAVYGDAPGSHMAGKHWAAWHTDTGTVHGWNVRAGWWPGPCLTLLAHTRPPRAGTDAHARPPVVTRGGPVRTS